MDIQTPPFRYRDWFDTSDKSDPSTPSTSSTPSDTQTRRFDPLAQRIAAMAPPPPDGPEVIHLEHDIDHEILSRILPHANPQRRSKPCQTTLGTPCARTWDDAWIAIVEAAEQRLQHRICGARTMPGTPCELESNHGNGRCRFHGGFPLTGAAPGNRNAVIHGLYSRRLRVCDPQCPLWNECPCAGPDVAALAP